MTAQLEATVHIPFDNTYVRLPDRFFARAAPTPVAEPRLIKVNQPLARQLGIDPTRLETRDGIDILAGNRVPEGADPIAQAYAGHQFAHFVPQLGDGRAILLGEVVDSDGRRRDIQLKGAGPTPFSRRGDGRSALGPVLREYLVSEAFTALGIPATRALAAVLTGERVARDTPLPGAVLTRIAASHIRIGTFQYFAARQDVEGLRSLADYVIARHYPQAADAGNRYRALLDVVIARQAGLVARWLHVGFIHGVMNTDNVSIAGETIDFGPCAFMDSFDPEQVYSSIDHHGRYAYAQQPAVAAWNLARLAETLIPLLADDTDTAVAEAQTAIDAFGTAFEHAYRLGLARKLGLMTAHDGDSALADDLLACMARGGADFTLTFRGLCAAALSDRDDADLLRLFLEPTEIETWLTRWRERLALAGSDVAARATMMRAANPAFIPRNHLVEDVITAAVHDDDFAPFETLLDVLSKPYDDQPGRDRFAAPPRAEQIVRQTFCGT
jgi:serine/tyrosine/threonine adenylyltransferase